MYKNQYIPPITKGILIINIILFILTYLLAGKYNLQASLSVYAPISPHFKSYQIITSMFMHADFPHILFNMMTLLSFGPLMERVAGEKRYLFLYLASGIVGYLLYSAWNLYEIHEMTSILTKDGINVERLIGQNEFSDIAFKNQADVNATEKLLIYLNTPMLGASGAISGIVAAFSTLYPEAEMSILFIPFPIKAKILLPIFIIGSIILGFNNVGNIAHFAHLGGALFGIIWAFFYKKKLYRLK